MFNIYQFEKKAAGQEQKLVQPMSNYEYRSKAKKRSNTQSMFAVIDISKMLIFAKFRLIYSFLE